MGSDATAVRRSMGENNSIFPLARLESTIRLNSAFDAGRSTAKNYYPIRRAFASS